MRLSRNFAWLLMFACWLPLASQAAIDTYEFSDEELRVRYRALAAELRCPKCQNQNIADSNAPIAMDLRAQLFRLLNEGYDDEQIIEYMVTRYGEFIRYRPAFNASTWLLWLAPALFVIAGVILLLHTVRHQRAGQGVPSPVLSESEKKQLAELAAQSKIDE